MNLIEIPKNEGVFDCEGHLEKMCNVLIGKAIEDLKISNSTFIHLDWGTAERTLGKEVAQKIAYGAEKELVLSSVASAFHSSGYFIRVKYTCLGSTEGYYISRMRQMNTKFKLVQRM